MNASEAGMTNTLTLLERLKTEMPEIWGSSASRRSMGVAGIHLSALERNPREAQGAWVSLESRAEVLAASVRGSPALVE